MKLTKDQRHIAYIIMSQEVKGYPLGFCALSQELFDINIYSFGKTKDNGDWNYSLFKKTFPELFAKVKKPLRWSLFKDNDERYKALLKCIEETY